MAKYSSYPQTSCISTLQGVQALCSSGSSVRYGLAAPAEASPMRTCTLPLSSLPLHAEDKWESGFVLKPYVLIFLPASVCQQRQMEVLQVLSSPISHLTYSSLLLTRPVLLKSWVLPPVAFSHDPDILLVWRWEFLHTLLMLNDHCIIWENIVEDYMERVGLSMGRKVLNSWGKSAIWWLLVIWKTFWTDHSIRFLGFGAESQNDC